MKLRDLLKCDDIVIQCHDNPDADALASGFAIKTFFDRNGKNARFIYRGSHQINKSNLKIMIEDLEIPVEYVPDFEGEAGLLITVDCQAGQKNVTDTPHKHLAIIDHHQITTRINCPNEIRSNQGSCATICWDMLKEEGIDVNSDSNLATALYYGLYSDTNKLSEMNHPVDRDMIDDLQIRQSVITKMVNSNISLGELKITGAAILGYEYLEQYKCLVIEAEQCDPCILGVISDFSLETENVDICIAYYVSPAEVKFSVRSCTKEVHANELAGYLADGLGGGGGHILKAGGMIRPELLDEPVNEFLHRRLNSYYTEFEIIYAKDTTLDVRSMKRYAKLPQALGAVRLTDVFEEGTNINVRTLEGDVSFQIEDFTYLMIGIEGEVWPISEDKLASSYNMTNFVFQRELEYEPKIINTDTGETKKVLPYAKTVMSKGTAQIYAKPLDHKVKVFTAWADEKYYFGDIGDYLAVRTDDAHDIYVINGRLFDQLYKSV